MDKLIVRLIFIAFHYSWCDPPLNVLKSSSFHDGYSSEIADLDKQLVMDGYHHIVLEWKIIYDFLVVPKIVK